MGPGSDEPEVFADTRLAAEQHRELVRVLQGEGVECHLISAHKSRPYQCYTRDSCAVTPWGLLRTRMGFGARENEPGIVERYAMSLGIPLWKQVTHGTLEGGDVQILRSGLVVIGHNGVRTTEDAALQVKSWFEECGWTCRVVGYPPTLRHIDLALGVLGRASLICCREMLELEEVSWLAEKGYTIHELPAEECLNMGCNILNIGGGTVIAHAHSERSNELLQRLGLRVIKVNVSEFAADLGGIHCLVQAVRREPA
ncbi:MULTISPECIES: dimethylarginine dimethylaminohydrolase family protein [unclassified Bradyrhizobium]|nr:MULTISPECIES: arginine deiminase family protein [unclassified Bradyrhizobium]